MLPLIDLACAFKKKSAYMRLNNNALYDGVVKERSKDESAF
jgi:hypothetical protein